MLKRQLFVGDVVMRESYDPANSLSTILRGGSSYGVPIGTVGEVIRLNGLVDGVYDVKWPKDVRGNRCGYQASVLFLIIPLVPDDQ